MLYGHYHGDYLGGQLDELGCNQYATIGQLLTQSDEQSMSNPFESPREVAVPVQGRIDSTDLVAERVLALSRYTKVILVLAVPAVVNVLLFNYFVTGRVDSRGLFILMATLNVIGVALVIFGLLFGGFYYLELMTRLANRIFGGGQRLNDWYRALFSVLQQALTLAVPAALLWLIWLAMFYATDVGFFLYSIPIALASHLMAASLYCGLFWKWYKIRTS